MVRTDVYDLEGKAKGKIDLPVVFEAAVRPDVVKRAVLAQQSHRLQAQGRDPMAGKRTSAVSMGTGHHLSRVPRVKGGRYPKAQKGAFAPSTVGGRETHPPKSEKGVYKKINRGERLLAIRSAIAATSDKGLVAARGHVVEGVPAVPLVLVDEVQEVSRASEAKAVLERLGLLSDSERVRDGRKIRAGKGTRRGRRWRQGVGPLFVVDEDKGVRRVMRNFPGVEVVKVDRLSAEALAPGASVGRLTVWSSAAVKRLDTLYGGVKSEDVE